MTKTIFAVEKYAGKHIPFQGKFFIKAFWSWKTEIETYGKVDGYATEGAAKSAAKKLANKFNGEVVTMDEMKATHDEQVEAPVETVKEQEAAQPVASPAPFNPEPFCQALAMAVAAYIPPFEVCGSWEVDVHFQASRQLEAWQAAHPDVDIFPLIFGFFVDDDIEIEDFDLGEPGTREGEEEEDLHPTHGALPEWMYANEQEPYALSPAPMQHQHEHEQQPIIDTLRAMLAERRDKPAQDMLLRLVQEYEDEGAGNDGLLFAYIKEAAQTLYEVVERVKPEQ